MAIHQAWSYWLKSLYRREPLLAIALTAGSADFVLGAAYGSFSLGALGLAVAAGGAGLLWQKTRRCPGSASVPAARLYLPDRAPPPLHLDQGPDPKPPHRLPYSSD